jgi:hypothetical protein
LGNTRSLHDYEVYAGFDFKRQLIQEYTLKVNEPPNPTPWENGFSLERYLVECEWETSFFRNYNFTRPLFLSLGIQTKSGLELHRKDFTVENDYEYLTFEKNEYSIVIDSNSAPYKFVMYLYDEEKKWSDRYEKNL